MRFSFAVLAALVLGCGNSTPPAKEPDPSEATSAASTGSAAPEADAAPKKDEAVTLPTACANPGEKVCVMPEPFVNKLCSGFYPDLALLLFSPSSPWTRAYVNIKEADAWNSRSGPSSDAKLFFDEEVIVISEKKPDLKGMSVSGAGSSYDFFRWDGTCATLTAAEMTLNKPPKAKTPDIPWRSLEDATKEALTKDEKFAKLAADRRKECKGASIGSVSDKCEKVDKLLNSAIVEMVRKGVEIPKPAKMP
jgi:hypothetical protein